jgi:ABC-type multidrug transport system ATPase subunit
VLFGVALDAPATGAVAVLGLNGAGKSTLLKTLAASCAPVPERSCSTASGRGSADRDGEYRVPAL